MFFKSNEKLSEKTDDWLINKFNSTGDLAFLGVLYERYMHLVYGVCLKYLKERPASQDAVMQIFEKLIVELPKRAVENFKPWLYVMTKNHCLMSLRSEKARLARDGKMSENVEVFMESSNDMHLNNERVIDKDLGALQKCIDQLKKEQGECIKLFYLEERSYQEIADETKYELRKVKSYIQNGKRNLKICMDQHG